MISGASDKAAFSSSPPDLTHIYCISVAHSVLTCVEPGGVLPVELELDEAEGEDDEADQRRGERREKAQPEAMVDPVVGECAAIWWWNV